MRYRTILMGAIVGAICSGPALAQSLALADESIDVQRGLIGPDVTLSSINQINSYGPVGTRRAFIGDSFTCNIGDQDLQFGFSWDGSPVLAFNLYRLASGRLEQIGMSWGKHACCAAQQGGVCGSCNAGSGLGPGCLDVYSAGWNASQSNLGPRGAINAYTGAIPGITGVGGSAIAGRLQAEIADLQTAGALYFMEGVYVGADDAPAGNAMNNASYRRVNVSGGGASMNPTGPMFSEIPAIQAWQDNDASVEIINADVPGEGRFIAAAKVSDNGDGTFRYEYAVFNLNSHRSGGSFSIPIPSGVSVTGAGFNDVDYHSGEAFDNTDWTISVAADSVTWSSPQTFAENANSNALRWGTMYNYWFDASAAPEPGSATLGLFRTGSPGSIAIDLPVPGTAGCNEADLAEPFGSLDFSDVAAFLVAFGAMDPAADLAPPFGSFDFSDVTAFLASFGAGCP